METTKPDHEKSFQPFQRIKRFGSKYKGEIGLGTVGEVWDVEWILDLPIFRPPGKY